MDLELNLHPGRPGKPLTGHVVRELELSDVGLLDLPREAPVSQLQKIKDSHHMAARLVAQGMGPVEVSIHTGYTPQRITDLLKDPAFQDLMEVYRKDLRDTHADVAARLAGLALDAIGEIHDRVRDTPEDVTTGQLTEIAKTALDRIGYGPQSKSTNVNVNVDIAGRLEAARRRAGLLKEPGS